MHECARLRRHFGSQRRLTAPFLVVVFNFVIDSIIGEITLLCHGRHHALGNYLLNFVGVDDING